MKKQSFIPKSTPMTDSSTDKNAEEKKQVSPELENMQEELAAANDKYLRLYSEFENFRKRSAKEKLVIIETASKELLRKLLPIVDDFERAINATYAEDAAGQAVREGILLIYNKLTNLLQQSGVRPMPLEKGASFDTELHEAVTQQPTEDPAMKGKVLDVIEKGYLLKENVLRFAKVITGA